jgi:hypothetical protein
MGCRSDHNHMLSCLILRASRRLHVDLCSAEQHCIDKVAVLDGAIGMLWPQVAAQCQSLFGNSLAAYP